MNTVAWMLPSYVESTCTQHTNSNTNKLYPVFFCLFFYTLLSNIFLFVLFLRLLSLFVALLSPPLSIPPSCTYVPLDGLLCLVCMVKVPTTAPMLSLWKPSAAKQIQRATQIVFSGPVSPWRSSLCSCGSFPPLLLPLAALRSVSEGATPSSSR